MDALGCSVGRGRQCGCKRSVCAAGVNTVRVEVNILTLAYTVVLFPR